MDIQFSDKGRGNICLHPFARPFVQVTASPPSGRAVADLARLREFIATNEPSATSRIAADLIARIKHLYVFPEMGRSVAQAPDPETVRDFIFGKYVVRYTVPGNALVVLRIWHHHENR